MATYERDSNSQELAKKKTFDFFCVAPETELGTYGKNYKEVDFYLNIKKNFLVN